MEGIKSETDLEALKAFEETLKEAKDKTIELKRMFEAVEKQRIICSPHVFWDTQPVRRAGVLEECEEGIIKHQTVDEIQKEPYELQPGFEWCDVDLHDETQLHEVYEFLRDNYVEDKSAHFRFDY